MSPLPTANVHNLPRVFDPKEREYMISLRGVVKVVELNWNLIPDLAKRTWFNFEPHTVGGQ